MKNALTGRQKAAVLMLSLGENISSQIIEKLGESEIEQLFLEIANLGKISQDTIKQVSQEFYDMCLVSDYINQGGVTYARELLEKALGLEKAEEIINKLTASLRVRPFDFAQKADAAQLLNYIQGEHPQTIALILAHLEPDQTARIFSGLPPDKQGEVAYRIAIIGGTAPGIIKEVENIMEKQLSTVASKNYTSVGGLKQVAEILNRVDRATEKKIIEGFEDRDPELAEQVKKSLFVFEDMVQLDDRYVQIILREIDTRDLATALKGATETVYQKVAKNISKRAAENLKEEIGYLGPVRIRDVEESQQKIVSVIRRLEAQGEVVIFRGEEDQIIA